MFSWLPTWLQGRSYRIEHATFDPAWNTVLDRTFSQWNELSDDERERMRRLIARFIVGMRWEAARGFTITDDVKVVIAAHATLLLLGLDIDDYPDVSSVIVHRRALRLGGAHASPAVGGKVMSAAPRYLAGQATYRGPVMLSWAAVERALRWPQRGENVVIHEFAHRLDMLDGATDGTPPLDGVDTSRWADVFTDAFERLRDDGSPVLRAYGATNPAEFFAVATEVFFGRPHELREHEAALYAELSRFFQQDPASRRATRSSSY